MLNADADIKKWGAVLDHEGATPIKDNYRRAVTAKLLENTEVAIREQNAQGGSLTEAGEVGGASAGVGTVGTGFDPILISMVRRAMPNLIAYDIAGVQPMQAPTGLIFAMKAQKGVSGSGGVVSPGGLTDNEILFGEADTAFSAEGTTPTSNSPFNLGIDDGANTKNFSPGDAATNAAYSPVGGRLTSAASSIHPSHKLVSLLREQQ
jgi:hypothetical protein